MCICTSHPQLQARDINSVTCDLRCMSAPFLFSNASCEKVGLCTAIASQIHAFLVEPPAPSRAKMTVRKTTNITILAVSPWRVPMPKSQYQWMPTLGGSPAKAGNGTAAAAAAAATAVGTCALLEMNAGTQAQIARRASRATLSSCDPLRDIFTILALYAGVATSSSLSPKINKPCGPQSLIMPEHVPGMFQQIPPEAFHLATVLLY